MFSATIKLSVATLGGMAALLAAAGPAGAGPSDLNISAGSVNSVKWEGPQFDALNADATTVASSPDVCDATNAILAADFHYSEALRYSEGCGEGPLEAAFVSKTGPFGDGLLTPNPGLLTEPTKIEYPDLARLRPKASTMVEVSEPSDQRDN